MKFEAVTTTNAQGWESFGARMAESFKRFWPEEIPLTIYAEGFQPDSEAFESRALPEWQKAFKARHQGPLSRGETGKGYNYRFDAVKFSHKVGAICDAMERTQADVLIWIDADTFTHAPVSDLFLQDRFPPWAQVAWLDRTHLYPECGFFMLAAQNPAVRDMMTVFRAMYEQDGLFALEEWHDSFVFEFVVKRAGLRTVSLSGDFRDHSHPFVNGPLGSVMDHMKGGRKMEGRSRRGDLRAKRFETYWNGSR